MTLTGLLILIVSIIAHEVAHGVAALWQGDATAKHAGRLTLNPIPHIDPVGSILLPVLFTLSGSPVMFGWAKPVPINPYNFRNQRFGEAFVAAAGPLTNLLIAGVFLIILKTTSLTDPGFTSFAAIAVVINIILALFNLMPIPPLDGSKILFSLIPQRFYGFRRWMEQKGFIVGLLVVLILWQFISPLVIELLKWLLE